MASPDDAARAIANVGDDAKVQSAAEIEPPSGIQGQGTKDSPYDAGNAPETTTQPGIEAPSGQMGEGAVEKPYDAGNAPEMGTSTTEQTQQAPVLPKDAASVEKVQAETATNFDTAKSTDTPGRDAKRALNASDVRDVSPGTLPDGSHAETAGDRGEVYEPSKMSKFKSKLGFGKS